MVRNVIGSGSSGKIFDRLREKALERLLTTGKCPHVRSIWATKFCCQPSVDEQVFKGYLVIAQSSGQGCCLSDTRPLVNFRIVGDSVLNHVRSCDPVSIALLDSLYDGFSDGRGETLEISGDPSLKAQQRAEIVIREALKLVDSSAIERTVVLIGFVGKITTELVRNEFAVFVTDQRKDVIGKSHSGIMIEDSSLNKRYVQSCKLAIVTGMTLCTNTLDEILGAAKDYGTKVLIFAQTGASLAREYLEFGAQTVIAEPFPIYDFHGTSTIIIHR